MTEELLKSILNELVSLNKKIENIEEVVEIISGKMNDTEEQSEKLIATAKAIEKSTDGVRSDISDLQSKVIYNMPNLGNLEYTVNKIDFETITESLKQIAKNTQ
ncbi:hypothetical protein [Chryseobacterium oryzae]|uniref:Uncharacterized protein n=1 Tax=Chryseobacterium oryzae TaxID=2929799 RepID=A0ABY4BLS1_9FLAO|nr:hypothetical protein [Chryseobacterium oryzae]UOE39704.1 hypothetical protein MTP08_14525 [Chryseobacterium oryzae]